MKVLIFLLVLSYPLVLTFAQDHTENVSGPFETVQEVTEECLLCHDDSGEEVLQSNHWNWLSSNVTQSTYSEEISDISFPINSFCIAVDGDSTSCITCHLTAEQKETSFEFNDAVNIDCLVCHDQTGTYVKVLLQRSNSSAEMDLLAIAQSVANPTSNNCGTCHFSKTGGVLLKHGGMDKSFLEPSEEIDYHQGGLGFGCSDCHETTAHNISGGSTDDENKVACENCHDSEPHEKELINNHYSAVTCETCHIPTYAREEAAVAYWDWSKAGEDIDPSTNSEEKIYDKKLGELIQKKNVKPEYYWRNGSVIYYELGEQIGNTKLVDLNKPAGSITDPDSKISPFAVLKSKQPYDIENKYLIIPEFTGENGYWKTFNWVSASEKGMDKVNLEFSGKVDFVETKMYRPINHLVMSANNALGCTTCHGKGGENLLDWKALGYPDDPIKKSGRAKNKLLKE
jgi:octaheme c-type cytochrome (tetrathionate reductase family)